MVMSKNKGNTFERKVSKIMSERFKAVTGLENSFRRNIDSGSFFGGKNSRRKDNYDLDKASFGDIVCPINFKYNIECKHYKTPPHFNALLKNDHKEWDGWIEQAKMDCSVLDKKMMVVVKYNNVQEFVIVDEVPEAYCFNSLRYKNYHIVPLDQFLSMDDKEFFG